MEKKSFFKRFKKTIITFGVLVVLFFALAFYVGFHHIPHHVKSLWDNLTYSASDDNDIVDPNIQTEVAVTTDYTIAAPEFPLDTLMWANAIKNGDYIPDGVKEELEMIRKKGFPNLVVANEKPSNIDIKHALVQRFGEEAINMLKQNDATLKGGTAYNAPLRKSEKNGQEIARVTISVSAFNSKGINLLNIQEPMLPVYDFVKYEDDPATWYVTDMSQTIPFDYILNKRD